ncbi:MAG: YidC/Oxa1 family membrane protein insertase [Eubacterium sp.]|nr:YidC/Oxa1 family membrane protein insertase [Eubacterium sp.]MBR0438544.1 YidC/Oxa1 family membrane protein insertase [Clostridia bacterium]
MSISSLLSTFFIGPLKLVFEVIFQASFDLVQNPGLCIILLSLAMNLLVLPLYKRADAMQEQARDIELKLSAGIKHIKKTFSGNERMMMLQTYYRQNHYSPLNALRGSLSLLLEIPFFMAAYQFLSNLSLLQGVSFGPIANLGTPDGLLTIGSLSVNLLPILMTLINFISSAIYLRGFPLKTKVQLYGIAVVFLVLLYNSPAGLVFYWTLNNVFSLGKNIVMKLLQPRLDRIHAAALQKKEIKKKKSAKEYLPDRKLFIVCAVFLTVLIGLLIPSAYISSSPQEFVDPNRYFNPIWYIVSAFLLAGGFFLLWFSVFYWLANPKGKVLFEKILWVFCGIAVIDYLFFGTRLGVISALLKYEGGVSFLPLERIINLVTVPILVIVFLLILRFRKGILFALLSATLALCVMSGINTVNINKELKNADFKQQTTQPHFPLSTDGQNVVVIFLDRAVGQYVPYFVQEKPELKKMYDGFTYYSNTISFGGHTNFGTPALMGGYEYTPVELNRRDNMTLKDKHNESLKVMPTLFRQNGYDVTVCDAPYANYQWIPDMSIYDNDPSIHTFVTKGYFMDAGGRKQVITNNLRNFFCFSIMKTLPLELQPIVYNSGMYYMAGDTPGLSMQVQTGMSESIGMNPAFMEPYQVLDHLEDMTRIQKGTDNNFLFFYNDTPHEPMLLQEPEYEPRNKVDNTEYDKKHTNRFTVNGKSLTIETDKQMVHYQTNMAVLLRIGKWLDYLREKGVYDNTRIIIVSDHGYHLYQVPDMVFVVGKRLIDTDNYFPLLMVKDFYAKGFSTSDTFMTNADVPYLAVKDLIQDPVNPFTGNPIAIDEKTAHDQLITTSMDWNVATNNGCTFNASGWASVHDNIHDRENWSFTTEKIVLQEHKLP